MIRFSERRLFFLAGFLLVAGSIAISGLLAGSSVQADANTTYCSSDGAIGSSYFNDDHNSKEDALKAMTKDDKGVCAANLVKDFNTKYKDNNRQMAVDDMARAISTCRTGESEGYFAKMSYGKCANAYYTCMERALQASDCFAKNKLSSIATECHDGTGVQDNGEAVGCSYITDANVNYVNKQRDDAKSSYDATCDALSKKKTDPSEQNKSYNSCMASMNGGLDNCKMIDAKSDIAEYGHGKIPSNFVADTAQLTSYNNCLQQAKNTAAKDNPELCDAVNGGKGFYVYAETISDPTGGNSNVERGCYSNYSDLKNATACETVGGMGVWAQEAGKTGDDGWGCHSPSEVCSGNGKAKEGWKINDLRNCTEENIQQTDKDDPNAECPKDLSGNCASVAGTDTHCGDARVNLLGCGEGTKGADAFTAILKIIIIVLTVLVGIAAVGGLAYAALTYARAEDNSGTVSEAKTLIRNIVIGIVLYGFLIAIVTWLVPGLSLT